MRPMIRADIHAINAIDAEQQVGAAPQAVVGDLGTVSTMPWAVCAYPII